MPDQTGSIRIPMKVNPSTILGGLIIAGILGGIAWIRAVDVDMATIQATLARVEASQAAMTTSQATMRLDIREARDAALAAQAASHTHIPGRPGMYAPGAVEPE